MGRYISLQEKERKDTLQRAVLAMLGTGMVAWPSFGPAYAASTITDINGQSAINTGDTVHNIYAQQKISNTVGVNKFNQFDVAGGDVANMHFRTSNTSTEHFSTLMNFVNQRININGTVNAIRNGKIGGHLYFLSPNGMVVGASGAINTGSLTVMTPTSAWWNDKITNNNLTLETVTAVSELAIPINASGSIVIQGKVNATDDVRMKAGKINIGLDENDANLNSAQLITGTTDFASLVNMNSEEMEAAGVSNLTAVRTANSGDVELKAEASYNENKDASGNTVEAVVNIDGGSEIKAVRNVNITATATNNVDFSVYVDKDGETRYCIEGEYLSDSEFKDQYADKWTAGQGWGATATTKAKINITHGSITGETVKVDARAEQYFSNSTFSSLSGLWGSKMLESFAILLNGLDIGYADITNFAEVNVGENSVLTAKADGGGGNALQVSARADVDCHVGTRVMSLDAISKLFGNNFDFIPSVNVNYANVDNDAKVSIDGTLKAEMGSVELRADATDNLSSTATTGLGGLVMMSNAVFDFAVNVVDAENHSHLAIGEKGNIMGAKSIGVQANATNGINVSTDLAADNNVVLAFLLNYLDNQNESRLDVKGSLTSTGGNITINSQSAYTENIFSGETKAGKGFFANFIGDAIGNQGMDDVLLNKFSTWLSNEGIADLNNVAGQVEYDDGTLRDKIADKLKAGISFGYMNESNKAAVNFSKDASAVAAGNLQINALSDVGDVQSIVIGNAMNQKEYSPSVGVTKPGVTVGGAILLRTLDYDAQIVLNGGLALDGSGNQNENVLSLQGAKVALNAQALAPYSRTKKMYEAISSFVGVSEGKFKESLGDLTSEEKDVLWKAYKDVCDNEGMKKIREAYDGDGNLKPGYEGNSDLFQLVQKFESDEKVQKFSSFLETGKFTYLDNSGVEHTIDMQVHRGFTEFFRSFAPALLEYVHPENYLNYYVAAKVSGRTEDNAEYGVDVNFGLDKVNNNAQVLVGSYRKIETINSGDMEIAAVTSYGDAMLDGSYLPSLHAADKFGCEVGVGIHHLNNSSIVIVAEGAKLASGRDLGLRAETDVLRVAMAVGMGSSAGHDVSGAVNVLGVNSNNIISVDDEAALSGRYLDMSGYNNTTIIGIAGGFALGYNSATGIAVSIMDVDRNNIIGVMDNDAVAGLTGTDYAEGDTDKQRQQKVLAKTITLESAQKEAFFGTAGTVKAGEITVDALDVGTVTEGDIINAVADVSVVNDSNGDAAGKMASLGNWFNNKKVVLKNKISALNNNFLQLFGAGDDFWMPFPADMEPTNPHAGQALPALALTGVASLGLNEVDAKTVAVLDGIKITFNNTGSNNVLNVYAGDRSLLVSATGSMAFNFTKDFHGSASDTAVFTGAGAVNDVKNDVHALIANNVIENADRIVNTAEQAGDLGAGALGADVARSSSTAGIGGGAGSFTAGASLNFADYDTLAELKNNKVNESSSGANTSITNVATNKSYQFTANAALSYVQAFRTNGGVGASFGWGILNNDTHAFIDGGKYLHLGDVKNMAVTDLTEISAVLGVGVGKSEIVSGALEGAAGINLFDNDVKASVTNVTEMNAATLSVEAYDTKLEESDTYKKYVSGKRLAATVVDNKTKLEKYNFDTTGEKYIQEAKLGMDQQNNDAYLRDHGNSLITVAVEVDAQLGAEDRTNVAIGAAVVYNRVNNDFASEVDNSTITLSGNSDVKAESTTRAVAVAAGGNGASHGFAGGGSVGLNMFENDVVAKVANSTVKTSRLIIDAFQRNTAANLVGHISISDLTLGLSWAENYLNTNTNAFLTDSNVSNKDDGKTVVEIHSEDDALMYAVAATGAGTFSQEKISATANGAVAVNLGRNNVRAEASSSTGKTLKLSDFTVKSVDNSNLRAGAGGLNVGTATVSIGGAFAVNQIGGLDFLHQATATEKQVNSAKVAGYTIELGNNMSVEATDTARFDTISVGCGLGFSGSKVAVQGADATTQLDKSTLASVSDVDINNGSTNAGQVKVLASTDNKTKTVGVVGQLAFSSDGVSNLMGIGLGRSRNLFTADTTASLADGTYNLTDLLIKSVSKQTVENDTIGAGIVKSVVNVGGTFTVNDIANNTIAVLGDSTNATTVNAKNNVGVISQSDEEVENYTGKANFGIANTFSMGTSIASNEVTGDTLAKVLNATVTALGKSGGTLSVRDSAKGNTGNFTGLVVAADAKHDFFSAVFTADLNAGYNSVGWGSSGGKIVTADVGFTVNTDYMGGTTRASVENSEINKDNSSNADDVTVKASDFIQHKASNTNAVLDILFGEGIAISVGGGISKNEDVRTVEAIVDGDTNAQGSIKKVLNADNLTVFAKSKSVAEIINTAVSVAASGLGSGGVNVGVTYLKEDETTNAYVEDVTSKNKGLNITSEHNDDVDMYATAVVLSASVYSAGIGTSVATFDNFARTNAALKYSAVEHTADNTATDVISANNVTDSRIQSANVSVAASIGGAVGVLVNNNTLQESVYAGVVASGIGTDTVRTKEIDVISLDSVATRFNNQNISGSLVVGIGVGVGQNKIDSAVRSDVNGSTLYSAGDITIKADETKNINGTMVAATIGAVDIGVSVLHNYIGLAVAGDDYDGLSEFTKVVEDDVKDKDYDSEKVESKTAAAKTSVQTTLTGLKNHITDKTSSGTTTVDTSMQTGGTNKNLGTGEKAGVQTNLLNANLYAKGNIDVISHTVTDTDTHLGGGNLGAVGVNVEVNRQLVEEKLGATISGGKWQAEGNITVSALSEGALNNQTVQAGYNGVGVAVTQAETIKQNEGLDISLTNVDLTAKGNLSVTGKDTLSLFSEVTAVDVGLGVNAAALLNTVTDNASGKITVNGGTWQGDKIEVEVSGTPSVYAQSTQVGGGVLHGSGMINTARTGGDIKLNVSGDVKMYATDEISLGSSLYKPQDGYNLQSNVHAVGISGIGIEADKSRTCSQKNVATHIGFIDLAFLHNSSNVKNVNIYASDNTTMKNYIRTTAVGAITSESNFGQSELANTVTTTLNTNNNKMEHVDNLNVSATANTKVDDYAKASSGSTIGIMPYAAQVENNVNSSATLTIEGNYDVGSAKLYANQVADMQLCADALTVTLVGGAGTRVYNTATFNTTTNLRNVKITTNTGDLIAYASTDANLNKETSESNENYMLKGNGVGVIDIESAKAENNVTINDTLNVTNSELVSAGNIYLGAVADGVLRPVIYDYTVNAVGGVCLHLVNNINSTNIINLGDVYITNTKAEKDITIGASDNLEVAATAYSEMTAGAAGATSATTDNTINRTNTLNLKSGSIYGLQDINLFAGKDEYGHNSNFTLFARAETYCGAVIPFSANPTLNNYLTQNNTVNVNSGMNIQSIRHANVYASHGTEHISLLEARHSVYKDKNNKDVYVATEQGNLADSGEKYNNRVKVDGSITAGISNVVSITIGDISTFVVSNDAEKAMIKAAKNQSYKVYTFEEFQNLLSGGIDIEADKSSGITPQSFKFGVSEYVSELNSRYMELQKLVSDAEMDGDKTAYQGYKAEMERISNLMAKMEHIDKSKEMQIYAAYIEIPDIVASGGNVNVDTGTFYGSGKVEAKGTPSVTITNNTNLMLKVNDILVDDPGGQLNYNDMSISGSQQQIRDSIARYNADQSLKVGLAVTVPEVGTDNAIKIEGKWSGSAVSYGASSYVMDGKTVKIDPGSMYALSNIEINGNINSKKGNVSISSEHNDINIAGGANISGKVVELFAPGGTIAQGFTDGIVNIGGSVQTQFNDLYNRFIENRRGSGNTYDTYNYSDGGSVPNGGRIDGGEIYINATDININGTIQSGYARYFVTIDGTVEAKIQNLKANNHNGDLTDEAVLGNSKYCVVEGKNVLTSGGYYERQVAVYYNPATDHLVVENVDASGGKIYLTGRISSTGSALEKTGNGAIYCLDGAYNIKLDNRTAHTLKTNELVVNDVQGLVQFTDITTGVKTKITRDGIKYYAVSDSGPNKGKEVEISASAAQSQVSQTGSMYIFTPTSGLKYNWTKGYSQTNYRDYYREFMAKWWGLADSQQVDSDTLSSWRGDAEPVGDEVKGKTENRPNGEYIGQGYGSSSYQVYVRHNYTQVSQQSRLLDTRRWTTGYLGCHKRWSYTWRETTGTVQSDVISVKADNRIGIEFIGVDANNSSVSVNSNGGLILNGNVGNMNAYDINGVVNEKGTVTLNASGVLNQNLGSIYGKNVSLSSGKELKDITITNGNILDLYANIYGKGNMDITARDRNGASVGNNISTINVILTGKDADIISLTADGNIVQKSNQITVADRIDLVSHNGGVYGRDAAGNQSYFCVTVGQNALGSDTLSASVNVTAKNDIWLKQTDGNMRVGKIYSDNGDIYLNVPGGGLVDALPYVERSAMEENDLLTQWKGMGIIAGGDSALNEGKNQALQNTEGSAYDNYCSNVRNSFAKFTEIQNKPEGERTESEKTELAVYQKQFEKPNSSGEYFASADEYLAQDVQAVKLAEVGQVRQTEYNVWDKDLLLYQLDDSIVNPKAGVQSSDKDPNLFGKNIYINVLNGVGVNSDKETRINMNNLTKANLKTLSQADPSTVTWEQNAQGDSVAVIKDRLAIGVQQSGSGSISITTGGNANSNVFLESRKEKSKNLANPYVNLDIAKIAAGTGNVTITSLGSIYDVNTAIANNANGYSTVATIVGGNIMLLAGEKGSATGNIGSADQYMRLYAGGNLTATATGNIYLEQALVNNVARDMNVLTVTAGVENNVYSTTSGNIYLRSASNIYGVLQDSRLQGYIRSDSHGEISLNAYGNIGYALKADGSVNYDKTIRIKNSDMAMEDGQKHDTITLQTITGSMNLEGVSTAAIDNDRKQTASGQLNFVSVSCGGQKFILTSNGDLVFDDQIFAFDNMTLNFAAKEIRLAGSITAKDVTFKAATKIYQVDGTGSSIEAKKVTLIAGETVGLTYGTEMKVADEELQKASVVQQYLAEDATGFTAPKIVTNDLTIKAQKVDMGSEKNCFNNAHVDVAKEVYLAGGGLNQAGDITIDITNSRRDDRAVQGNIDLRVYDTNVDTTLKNTLVIKGDLIANGDIVLFNEQGDLRLPDTRIFGRQDMITASGSFVTYTEGVLTNNKLVGVNGGIGLIAKGDIHSVGDYVAGKGLYLESLTGDVYDGDLQANNNGDGTYSIVDGSISLIAEKGTIYSSAMYYATGDVTLKAGHSITNEHGILSTEGNITIYTLGLQDTAGNYTDTGTLTNNAQLAALKGSVILYAHHDLVNNNSIEASEGLVTIIAGNEIVNGSTGPSDTSSIHGHLGVDLIAGNKLTNNQKLYADDGDIEVYGAGAFLGNGTQFGTKSGGGWVINSGDLYTTNGNVLIKTDSSTNDAEGYNLKNSGNMYAGNGEIHLESAHASVYNVDDFRNDFLNPTAAVASGSITLLAEEGSIVNNISLHAGTGITIHSRTDIDNTAYTLTAVSGNVELVSNEGHVTNSSTIGTGAGSVIMHGKDYVTNSGDIYATGGDIILQSDTSDVTYANTHDYGGSYTDGGIRLLAEQGKVNVNASLYAQKDIEMRAKNLTLGGNRNIISGNGDIILAAQNNLVIGDENYTPGDDTLIGVTVMAQDGDIYMYGNSVGIYEYGKINAKHNLDGNKVSGRVYVSAGTKFDSRFFGVEGLTDKITADNDVSIVATTGCIMNTGGIVVTNGDIDLRAADYISNGSKVVTGIGNITFNAQNLVSNSAVISSDKGDITFNSVNANVYNGGSLTAADGDITITALSASGTVTNEATVTAKGLVRLLAYGDVTNNGNITSGTITTGQPLTGEVNTGIWINSTNGTINIAGALHTTNTVVLGTNGNIDMKNSIDGIDILAYNDVQFVGGGTFVAGTEATKDNDKIISASGKIEIHAGGNISNYAQLTATEGSVVIDGSGAVYNYGNIVAAKNVSVSGYGNVNNNGSISVTDVGDVNIVSYTYQTADKLHNVGTITTARGTVLLSAEVNIENEGQITTDSAGKNGGDIKIFSSKGTISNGTDADITAVGGGISIIGSGNVSNKASLSAQNGDIYLASLQGNLTNENELSDTMLTSGNVTLMAENGFLSNTFSIDVPGSVTMKSKNDLTNSSDVKSENGDILLMSYEGSVTNNSSNGTQATNGSVGLYGQGVNNNSIISATKEVTLVAIKETNLIITDGELSDDYTLTGDVVNNETGGKISGGEGVYISAGGDVHNAGSLYAMGEDSNVSILAMTGNITNNSNFKASDSAVDYAQGTIQLTATKGSIHNNTVLHAKKDIEIYSYAGIINSDSSDPDSTFRGIESEEGNIIIKTDGMLKNNATLTTKKGDITIIARGDSTVSMELPDVSLALNEYQIHTSVYNEQGGTIQATGGNVSIQGKESVINCGDIVVNEATIDGSMRGGTLTIYSDYDPVDHTGDTECGGIYICNVDKGGGSFNFFDSDKDMIISSPKGDFYNEKDVLVRSGDLDMTFGGNIVNWGNELKALDGNVKVQNGTGKNMILKSKITAENGTVDLVSGGDMVLTGITGEPLILSSGPVTLLAQGNLTADGSITASQGDITVQATGNMTNSGSIQAQEGNIAISADRIWNYAAMDATQNIILLSLKDIYNGDESTQSQATVDPVTDETIHIYAGKDVVLLTAEGLDNRATLGAGIIDVPDMPFTGGNVILDDFEVVHSDLLSENVKTVLQTLAGPNYEKLPTESHATIKNFGRILAVQAGDDNNGIVHLDSQGKTENYGEIYSVDGTVFMDSSEDLINYNDIHVVNTDTTGVVGCDVTLQATGNLYNTGDIYVTGKGSVLVDADAMDSMSNLKTSTIGTTSFSGIHNTGNIYASEGDVTLQTMYGGNIYNTDELRDDSASEVQSGGSISFLAPGGDVVNTKALVAGKNITIDSLHDIYNLPASADGAAYSGMSVQRGLETKNGSITLISRGMVTAADSHSEGLVVNKGTLIANNGNIEITANGSQKTESLTAMETTDVLPGDLQSGITYSFLNDKEGNMVATNGNIIILAEQSVVTFGDMKAVNGADANGNISFTSNSGHTVVYSVDDDYKHNPSGHSFDAAGDMQFKAAKGYVYSDKGMHSKGDMVLEYGAGEQTGEIVSENGSVTLISRGADEDHRDLTISNKISAVNGQVKIVSTGNLTINDMIGEGSAITSKDDVVLKAEKNITVEDGADIKTTEGGIEIQSDTGNIEITGPVNADKFIRFYTKGDTTESRAWLDQDGEKYNFDSDIPLSDTPSDIKGDITVSGAITTNGDLDVSAYDGKITMQNVTAGGTAVVGSHNGQIKLEGTIKGDSVALYSEAENADISFEHIDVQENLILAGNNWSIDLNKVTMEADTNILIYGTGEGTGGTDGKTVINYNHGADKELHITKLQGANVEVHSDGPLIIDNVSIADKGEFYVLGTKTDIYGTMNAYDKDAAVIYYAPGSGGGSSPTIDLSPVLFGYDTAKKQEEINKLADNPHQFETGHSGSVNYGTGKGMSLHIVDKSLQYGNGIVLMDTYGSNVMSNRYSATDLMIYLDSVKTQAAFDNYFNIGFNFYERYSNIYIPDVIVNSIALTPKGQAGKGIVIVPVKDSDEYEF